MEKQPRINNGYIIIARNIIESEIWDKPPLYIKVWLYLLTVAQHSNYKKLKRGQLITSIPEIIEACSWKVGYRTEKPTKDQIFQIISWLRKGNEGGNEGNEKPPMITTTKATQKLLINIENYDFYQTPKNYESNNESDVEEYTKAEREQRQPDNINKNVKNEKNENKKIYIDFPINGSSFLNIYNHYFKEKFHKDHMKITTENKEFILSQIQHISTQTHPEEFEEIVSYHFDNLPKSNNGNILAFFHALPRYIGEDSIGS